MSRAQSRVGHRKEEAFLTSSTTAESSSVSALQGQPITLATIPEQSGPRLAIIGGQSG